MTLIEVKHISKDFVVQRDWLGRPKKVLTAVHDLSLTIGEGETVGLVGESGCGKSTFARTLLGLYAKTGGLDNGSLTILETEDFEHFSCLKWNDTSYK